MSPRSTFPLLAASFLTLLPLLALPDLGARDLSPDEIRKATAIRCNNVVYGNGKTSICFADKFLSTAEQAAGLNVLTKFNTVDLGSEALFESPFTVISGEGSFRFNDDERSNIKQYINCGGFLLASPGCSDAQWDQSFRAELKALFPGASLERLPMSHPIFSLFYDVPRLNLKSGGTTLVEALTINGRIAMIYSKEGLNDARNATGCCCCGGNQIKESQRVNVNILLYALTN